eukprot:TRINITY_DN22996_c0_g1_i4.p1 TRINITY_DN22996_c0_g1~~TRINITY_DN22996_c0_g1_i4.p1  ORF type:complete len:452 (+),score=66.99 TRINITY_DN22996_c0_g1_i4:72-1427(+)
MFLTRSRSAIEQTCVSVGDRVHLARTSAGGEEKPIVHPGMTVLACVILAFVYYRGVHDVYHGETPAIAMFFFVVFLVSGVAMVVALQVDSKTALDLSGASASARRWRGATGFFVLTFVWTMIVQFQLYMTLVAYQYPYTCELSAVQGGNGTNVTTFMAAGWQNLEAKRTMSLERAGGFDWDLECNDSVSVLGTRGGRETFALLSHLVPFVFVMLYVMGIGPTLRVNFAAMVIDFVDIQDFFAMLLDDNMILAYWNKADMYKAEGGKLVWTLVFNGFVLASIYISTFPIIKVLSVPRSKGETPSCVSSSPVTPTLVGGPTEVHADVPKVCVTGLTTERYDRCFGYEVTPACASRLEAVLSLCMIEIPFFVLRLYCSMRMRIIASSLMMKNFFAIVYDVLTMIAGGFGRKKSAERRMCWCLEPLFDVAQRMHEFFTGKEAAEKEEEVDEVVVS